MIKRFCFWGSVFCLAVFILFVSLFKAGKTVSPSFAAATLKFTVSSSPTPPPVEEKVNYYLPYPGMLPDQQLYKLKMVRDRIKLWFTNDPVKKTSLLLLYADKRVGAGKVLIEGNKVPLGISTLLKGEKYLEKAIEEAVKLQDEDKRKGNLSILRKAVLKHEEVVEELKEEVDSGGASAIEEILKFNQLLQERIDRISS